MEKMYTAIQKDYNQEVWAVEEGLTLEEARNLVDEWVILGFTESYFA